jgi:hypothetical protein
MGVVSRGIKIVSSKPSALTKKIAEQLKARFGSKDLMDLQLLFSTEDSAKLELKTSWSSVAVARKNIAAVEAILNDTPGVRTSGKPAIFKQGISLKDV